MDTMVCQDDFMTLCPECASKLYRLQQIEAVQCRLITWQQHWCCHSWCFALCLTGLRRLWTRT